METKTAEKLVEHLVIRFGVPYVRFVGNNEEIPVRAFVRSVVDDGRTAASGKYGKTMSTGLHRAIRKFSEDTAEHGDPADPLVFKGIPIIAGVAHTC